MLAYIFWHWPKASVVPREYEAALIGFHKALAAGAIPGFVRSLAFRMVSAPWVPPHQASYIDWYILDGSAALDPLNERAVTGACQAPHDVVARLLEGAGAGLYGWKDGEKDPSLARTAVWFGKPAGLPLAEFVDSLKPSVREVEGGLWTRRMGLGTTPEYVILAPRASRTPGGLDPTVVEIALIWATLPKA